MMPSWLTAAAAAATRTRGSSSSSSSTNQVLRLLLVTLSCYVIGYQFYQHSLYFLPFENNTATQPGQQQKQQQQQQEELLLLPSNAAAAAAASKKEGGDKKSASSSSKKKWKLEYVVTNSSLQGYKIPKDLIEWNLFNNNNNSSINDGDDDDGKNVPLLPLQQQQQQQKSFCAFNKGAAPMGEKELLIPMFRPYIKSGEWDVIDHSRTKHKTLCPNSQIRILHGPKSLNVDGTMEESTERAKGKLDRILVHKEGQQLTSPILYKNPKYHGKAIISKTIKESNSALLKGSLPTTRVFSSIQECHQFCDNEHAKTQHDTKWIWKPSWSNRGRGIELILPDGKCHDMCKKHNKLQLQAQVFAESVTIEDGRKFDIRSNILVANVHPLIVYAGSERANLCPESTFDENPTPYPGMDYTDHRSNNNSTTTTNTTTTASSSFFNPFQHICNSGTMGRHNPSDKSKKVYSKQDNYGPLSKGIPDLTQRRKTIAMLNDYLRELMLLFSNEFGYDGKVGMFKLFATDILLDKSGDKLWFLEINADPGVAGMGDYYPNPWGDVFSIMWTILQTYQEFFKNNGNNNNKEDWTVVLNERLQDLELEELRRII